MLRDISSSYKQFQLDTDGYRAFRATRAQHRQSGFVLAGHAAVQLESGANSRRSCANRKTGSIFHRALLHGHGYAALSQLKGNRLELSSSTAEIREICERRDDARAQLGDDAALELSQILADIEAFDTFADFDATFGNQITDRGNSEKCFHMRTGGVIVFRAGHPRNLGAGAAPPNWANTTRLMITGIERANA